MAELSCLRLTSLANLQGNFQEAVSSSYETVLIGVQSGHAHLIAESTINVGREGQSYVEMLAEVVGRLVRDGHGRAAARVSSSELAAIACLVALSQCSWAALSTLSQPAGCLLVNLSRCEHQCIVETEVTILIAHLRGRAKSLIRHRHGIQLQPG